MGDGSPEPRCPAAQLVVDGPKGRPAVLCGVMAHDQKRADSILEGMEVGVVISSVDDPSTFFGFCCGTDDAPQDPGRVFAEAEAGVGRLPCHYYCCPIWQAGQEIGEYERLFAAPDRSRPEERLAELGVQAGEGEVPDSEAEAWLEGEAAA